MSMIFSLLADSELGALYSPSAYMILKILKVTMR